jgi:hypothetical protein
MNENNTIKISVSGRTIASMILLNVGIGIVVQRLVKSVSPFDLPNILRAHFLLLPFRTKPENRLHKLSLKITEKVDSDLDE